MVAASRLGAVAALTAMAAVLVRWGAPTLTAAAGAQAVLGPAVLVGSFAAAASMALAAVAIALLTPPRHLPVAVAVGLCVGAVAAGPSLPDEVVVRVVGAVAGIGMAVAASRLAARRALDVAAIGAATVALVLAAAA